MCAISALGCVDLIIGGITYGQLHYPDWATMAAQLPVLFGMYALLGRALRGLTGPGGSPEPASHRSR